MIENVTKAGILSLLGLVSLDCLYVGSPGLAVFSILPLTTLATLSVDVLALFVSLFLVISLLM